MTVDPSVLRHSLSITDREKKIILIKYIMHGVSPFSGLPVPTKVKMLASAAHACGFDYDDEEWQELGRACLQIQDKINKALASFIKSNKGIHDIILNDGNDIIENLNPEYKDLLKSLNRDKRSFI